jgi:hypothetical protein
MAALITACAAPPSTLPLPLVPQPQPPSPPPAPPSNATSFQLEVANNCLQSPAVSAAKWYYTDHVVPPPEGSPTCRVRGTDAEGSYCMAYWLGVGPASTAAVVSTTVPQWYFTAYLSEDFNAWVPCSTAGRAGGQARRIAAGRGALLQLLASARPPGRGGSLLRLLPSFSDACRRP